MPTCSLNTREKYAASAYPTLQATTPTGDKVVEVAGTMTIRGKTNPAVLKAVGFNCYENPSLKREVCGGDFETVIKRSLYEVNWGLANRATSDDIKVSIQVEAIKQ